MIVAHTDWSGMNRRSFLGSLTSLGTFLLAGRRMPARPLYLVDSVEPVRISKIEWIVYDTGRRGPDSLPEHRCAVRLTTTSGVQGWADLVAWVMPDRPTVGLIQDTLLGRHVGEGNVIWRELFERGTALGALAAVDVALWDTFGRVENKPVHALLGTRRQQARACVSTAFNLGDAEQYAELAAACKEKGVHGIKVRPYIEWAGDSDARNIGFPDRDTAVYEAVRQAVGPDYPCMADNHGAYDFDEALRVGRRLDDLGYEWYQSPMPEDPAWLHRYVALASELRTPICAPQADPESYLSRIAWVTAKACDIACMDVHHGGLTACMELAAACEAAGARLELNDIGPDSYPHLHVLAATSESLAKYIELSSLSQDTRARPGRATAEPVFDEHGCVAVPQTPGMGVELDWSYIFAHRVS